MDLVSEKVNLKKFKIDEELKGDYSFQKFVKKFGKNIKID